MWNDKLFCVFLQDEDKHDEEYDDVDLVAQAEKEFYEILEKEKKNWENKKAMDNDGEEKTDIGKVSQWNWC